MAGGEPDPISVTIRYPVVRGMRSEVGSYFSGQSPSTALSKVESEKLDFAQYPSEELIRKLAAALEADVDELLLLAKKIPPDIRERVIERPDAFRKIASLDDRALDDILRQIEERQRKGTRPQ